MKAKVPLFSYCMERTFLFEPPEDIIHLSFGNAMSGREEGHTICHLVAFAAHLFVLPVQVDIFVVVRLVTCPGQTLQKLPIKI